jgi:hypothetical protein
MGTTIKPNAVRLPHQRAAIIKPKRNLTAPSLQAGAAELAMPDRRRSGPLGGQGATPSERPWGFICT